jgi:hypothetical protein
METYRKPAIAGAHLEFAEGSTCFRLFPGNRFEHRMTTTRVGKEAERLRAPCCLRRTTTMKPDNEQRDAFGEHVLHVGAGFKEKERSHVLETLSTLGPHLLG